MDLRALQPTHAWPRTLDSLTLQTEDGGKDWIETGFSLGGDSIFVFVLRETKSFGSVSPPSDRPSLLKRSDFLR